MGCGYGWMSLALKALSSARKLMQNPDSQHDTCKSYQAHVRGQVDPYPKIAGGAELSSSLRLASSVHEEMK